MKPPNHGCRVRITDRSVDFEGFLLLDLPRVGGWSGLALRIVEGQNLDGERYFVDPTMRIEVIR